MTKCPVCGNYRYEHPHELNLGLPVCHCVSKPRFRPRTEEKKPSGGAKEA